MATNRLLITGATGFLGQACRRALATTAWSVDALSSRPMSSEPGTTWHRVDLLDHRATRALVEAIRPTHLLHLAWHVGHGAVYEADANDAWRDATVALTDAFAATGGRRAVLVGSCAEYDWTGSGVFREGDDTTRASTRYGRAKAEASRLTRERARAKGMSLAWARPFFVYGQGEPPGKLVASVVRALLAGEEARCSHGRQVRDFVHVDDVASALVALLASDVEGAVNLGSGQPVPLAALVNEAARQLDATDRIRFGAIPSPAHEPPLIAADIRRLREEVGYTPRIDVEEGIRRSIAGWR